MLKSNRFLDADCEGPPKGCGGGSQCSANAKCTDTTESGDEDNRYTCVCKKDFIGDGQTCEKGLSLKGTVVRVLYFSPFKKKDY